MKVRRVWIFLLAFLVLWIGCAQVPITGRKGLRLLPESQLVSMSLQQFDQVRKSSKLSSDSEKTAMVEEVGRRVAGAAEEFLMEAGMAEQLRNYHWEFILIDDDDTVNAWCMPGGKVAVYTGILPVARDETGLAVIIGHEVAHAIAGHGNERMSQGLLTVMGGVALSRALSEKPDETRNLFMMAFGVGASLGVLLPYSRLHESEADRIGLSLMARAGYDPREAVPFWERMAGEGGGRHPPEFLSTHPAPATRIRDLERYAREAMPYYREALAGGRSG